MRGKKKLQNSYKRGQSTRHVRQRQKKTSQNGGRKTTSVKVTTEQGIQHCISGSSSRKGADRQSSKDPSVMSDVNTRQEMDVCTSIKEEVDSLIDEQVDTSEKLEGITMIEAIKGRQRKRKEFPNSVCPMPGKKQKKGHPDSDICGKDVCKEKAFSSWKKMGENKKSVNKKKTSMQQENADVSQKNSRVVKHLDTGPNNADSTERNQDLCKNNSDTIMSLPVEKQDKTEQTTDENTNEGELDENDDAIKNDPAEGSLSDPGVKIQDKKTFKCEKCNRTFSKSSRLKTHSCSQKFLCSLCGKTCLSASGLSSHLLKHKSQKIKDRKSKKSDLYASYYRCLSANEYECVVCEHKLSSRKEMHAHVIEHMDRKPEYVCEICGKYFKTVTNLYRHRRVHTGEKPYKCTECSKSFSQMSNLAAHMVIHAGTKPYVCDVCGMGFTQRGNLKSHKKVKHDKTIERFKCDVCQKTYSSLAYLAVHKELHTVAKSHCEVCKRQFSSPHYLAIHMKTHRKAQNSDSVNDGNENAVQNNENKEDINAGNFKCSICLKKFVSKLGYRDHMARHSNQKSYVCSDCGAGFDYRRQLRVHMKEHTGIHPYECKDCDMRFNSPYTFGMHKRKYHWKEESASNSNFQMNAYTCNHCSAVFGSSSHLTAHIRTHTGEKPYVCKECKRGFAQISTLKNHVRIHTGERPFVCDLCKRGFRQLSQLKTHKPHCQLAAEGNVVKKPVSRRKIVHKPRTKISKAGAKMSILEQALKDVFMENEDILDRTALPSGVRGEEHATDIKTVYIITINSCADISEENNIVAVNTDDKQSACILESETSSEKQEAPNSSDICINSVSKEDPRLAVSDKNTPVAHESCELETVERESGEIHSDDIVGNRTSDESCTYESETPCITSVELVTGEEIEIPQI